MYETVPDQPLKAPTGRRRRAGNFGMTIPSAQRHTARRRLFSIDPRIRIRESRGWEQDWKCRTREDVRKRAHNAYGHFFTSSLQGESGATSTTVGLLDGLWRTGQHPPESCW